MLEASRERLLELLGSDDVVLDIGGWADPFERADWVIDVMPYETRGLYQRRGWGSARQGESERFTEQTWIQRDLCDREPYPFADNSIDFVICSHTLEDVRDPLWICSEMDRIAKRGYIETPSRLEEQTMGVVGPFVGWSHHHWLVDMTDEEIVFVAKPHSIHGWSDFYFPKGFTDLLSQEERVQSLLWEGSFSYRERILYGQDNDLHDYLHEFVAGEMRARGLTKPPLLVRLRVRLALRTRLRALWRRLARR